MLVGGLTLIANENKIPKSEEPTSLQSYISKIELSERELNEREKEMLSNLGACASELSTYHEAYSAMGKLVGALIKFMVLFGILQLLAIGSVYMKSKTQPVSFHNSVGCAYCM